MGEPIAAVGDLAGICGHDGSNWEKILIDASKRLVIAVAAFSASLEVTQDTPADLLTGIHGYDGTNWKKQNLILGLVDRWKESLTWTMTAVNEEQVTDTVPTGYIYILQLASVQNRTSAGSTHLTRINFSGGPNLYLNWEVGVDQYVPTVWSGAVALGAGDSVLIRINSGNVDDVIWAGVAGYKMRIDM